jgi:hypothetical protein
MRLTSLVLSFALALSGLVPSVVNGEPAVPVVADDGNHAAGSDTSTDLLKGLLLRPKHIDASTNLDAAWTEYEDAVTKVRDDIRTAIAKQFDTATAKGDLDAAEKWQAIGKKFEQAGELPAECNTEPTVTAPIAEYKRAKDLLGKAYDAAVKSLTMDKKIPVARALRDERSRLLTSTTGGALQPRDQHHFRNHRYMVFYGKTPWPDAKKTCEALGGHLVTISSKEENDFVFGLSGGAPCWIGLYQRNPELPGFANFVWVTGERPDVYEFWRKTQPDGHQDVYAGISLMNSPEWDDFNAAPSGYQNFICEWENE